MRIVVSAQGDDLDAPASPVFGRCPSYLFVNTETLEFEAAPNPAMNQGGGAGIQAAQFVVSRGAEAVLTGNLGPNAFGVLQAAGVPAYLVTEGTVRQAVQAYQANQLRPMAAANVAAHAGMGPAGRGMARGMGRAMSGVAPAPSQSAQASNLAELREALTRLRSDLASTMARIDELEKER